MEAEVTQIVQGTTKVGLAQLDNPTPKWLKIVTRTLLYITTGFGLFTMAVNLQDFGVSEHTQFLIMKSAGALTAFSSILSRFTGIEPPKYN